MLPSITESPSEDVEECEGLPTLEVAIEDEAADGAAAVNEARDKEEGEEEEEEVEEIAGAEEMDPIVPEEEEEEEEEEETSEGVGCVTNASLPPKMYMLP